VARYLVDQGVRVVMNARDSAVLCEAAAPLGACAVTVSGSPSNAATAQDLVDAVYDSFGRFDALVNCAGVAEPMGSSILNITVEDWQELLDAHLGTAFHTSRVAAPRFVAQGSGSIVNTTSFAFLGDYGGTGYPAGKGAVNSLSMAIAAELKQYGIRVNAVAPGARTRLSTGADYERHIEELFERGMLDELTRHGSLNPAPPEYVARLYAYLVSDLSADVTGQILAGAGCFLGRFDKPAPTLLAYADHDQRDPWSIEEIDALVTR
jgi:NAD(P)-dependent dehydrogenase (short-subunit alcohol dehydrogenase family)